MSTVSFEKFLPEVLPYVHDCPEFAAINAIRNACIEFCNKTLAYQTTLEGLPLFAGESVIELPALPSDTTIAKIVRASIGRWPLTEKSHDELTNMYGSGWEQVVGAPQYISQREPHTLILTPIPSSQPADDLYVTIALRPTRASKTFDYDLYDKWAEVIAHGARARLHDTPGQPYSDVDAAIRFRSWFQVGMGKATIETNQSMVRSNTHVRMPRFV